MSAEEARDWDEYLAWTRNAAPGQYEITEERAWVRLQSAALRRRITPYVVRPSLEPLALPPGRDDADDVDDGAPEWVDPPARPEGRCRKVQWCNLDEGHADGCRWEP